MALADYFSRDEIAISQVLQGFQSDVFAEKLKGIRVAIAFDCEAARSRDGRDLLDLFVRLAARLYPTLLFDTDPAANQIKCELIGLARKINPNIKTSGIGGVDVCLSVGINAPTVCAPTIYAGCDGWMARVGTEGPYKTSDLGNPFGAGYSACLAAANLFRFLFLPNGTTLLDTNLRFPADSDLYPKLSAFTVIDPIVLVGVGAVGNAASWALARTPLSGKIHLVDPQNIELSNLQRYVLCERNDENGIKVDIVGSGFGGTLKSVTYQGSFASFLETNGYMWERIMVALDSANDRKAVQGSLPRWIANAWTQLGDLGVSTHSFLGQNACLACLYLPKGKSRSQDQIVAEGLKIPHLQDHVRVLLGSGHAIGRELCNEVANSWGIPPESLETFVGRPIRKLWVEGICGGGIIPLGEGGQSPRELEVPLAFQSALAGVLLSAETVRDVLTEGDHRRTLQRRLDLMKPLGDSSPQPALKAGTGNCICEDRDFIAKYCSKYGTESDRDNNVDAPPVM